jgi:S-DNA-T family DNA segregation ATPase FtsK/SpoIIIE
MKIGYNRAARIMEMLEEEGVVGPPGEAGKPREILWRRKQ